VAIASRSRVANAGDPGWRTLAIPRWRTLAIPGGERWRSRVANAGDPAVPRGDPAVANAGDPAVANAGDPAVANAGDPAVPRGDPCQGFRPVRGHKGCAADRTWYCGLAMKPEVVLELLESAAEQLKVRVSYEPLQTSVVHGGLCRVKGEYRIIVDKRASAEERVTTLATALATLAKRAEHHGVLAQLPASVQNVLRMHEPAVAAPGPVLPVVSGRTAA
jgi:hypothetical protein